MFGAASSTKHPLQTGEPCVGILTRLHILSIFMHAVFDFQICSHSLINLRLLFVFLQYVGYLNKMELCQRCNYITSTMNDQSNVIYKCLLVNNAVAPGTITMVCVSSIIIAGPLTVLPACRSSSIKTGVSTRPAGSKYTLCLDFAFDSVTVCRSRRATSEKTDSPRESKVLPIPRTCSSFSESLRLVKKKSGIP